MPTKKLIALAAALLLAVPAFTSCAPGAPAGTEPPITEPAAPETTDAPYAGPYLTIAGEGADEYAILFPEGSASEVTAACRALRQTIADAAGVRLDCENDELPAWQTLPEDAPEILVGLTNRPASVSAYEALASAEDYVIEAAGSRIVIVGGSDAATIAAVNVFQSLLVFENGAMRLRADLLVHADIDRTVDVAAADDPRYFVFTAAGTRCRLSYTGDLAWRLQTERGGVFNDSGAGQMLAAFLGEDAPAAPAALTVAESDGVYTITEPGGTSVTLRADPFRLTVKTKSGADAAVLSGVSASPTETVVHGELAESEAIFGTGERFNSVNQRGKRIEMSAIDQWCGIEGNSYMPIPLLISSRGYGVFMNRYERMTLDIGKTAANRFTFTVPDAPADLYLYASENPRDVLYGYSVLTGFAPEPAPWMYGTAVCRYSPDFSTAEGVYAMVQAMEENDFPWDAVILEGWPAYKTQRYNELKKLTETLHGMGKKVLVYTTTGRTSGTALPEAMHVTRADNGSADLPDTDNYNPVDNPNSKTSRYIDITNADAWEWWTASLWGRLVNKVGIDGAKIDFCEQFPDYISLKFASGASSSGAHHWYPTFYNAMLYRLMDEKEDGGMALARGGGIGAQRYPFIWAGDQRREYQFLAAQLRACLSAGMSGVPFMSYDMGGYRPAQNSDPEAGVFVRAVEFTAFSANIQTHGTVTRPYDFDEDVKAIYRRYAYVHEALRPYIEEQGRYASETGVPLMRHLALDYASDENVWNIDDEYLFGDGLLVAPVLDGSFSRDIYLPAGTWTNLTSGEVYEGAQTLKNVSVSFDEIPVFVKSDHGSAALAACLPAVRELLAEKR